MFARLETLASSLTGCLRKRGGIRIPFWTRAALASAIVAAGAIWSEVQHAEERSAIESDIENFMRIVRQWDVMDVVLTDYPSAEQQLVLALEADLSAERVPMDRDSETYEALWRMRNDYVFPRVLAANDDSVLDVWRSHAGALRYIAGWSTDSCVTFLELGLIFPELDHEIDRAPELQNFSRSLLQAYQNGGAAKEPDTLSAAEMVDVWSIDLNFQPRHWDTLTSPAEVPAATFCNTGMRMSTNLHLVEEGKRVDYARTAMGQRIL